MRDMLNSLVRYKRIRRWMETVNGLEYNSLHNSQRVSAGIYKVDIARNPRIVNSMYQRIDVLGEVSRVNLEREFVEHKAKKFKGRF